MSKKKETEGKKNPPNPEAKSSNALMYQIIFAILVGIFVGGWSPDFARHFGILGDIFMRALMMIVVPMIMLSMITGITGLGDIRSLGALGRRTFIFYMVTTGISVAIGLFLVNLIKPGETLSPGEKHPLLPYTISKSDYRTVKITRNWERVRYQDYRKKYAIFLDDQKVWGVIEKITPKSATVRFWERLDSKGVIYVKAENGIRLPFRRLKGRLISAEPKIRLQGKGVRIGLALADKVRGKESKGVASILKDVLLGMIPRNIFDAMAKTQVLSLIFFSLLLGGVLSLLGERGRKVAELFEILNDAIMRIVHWIMAFAPAGIFGLVAARIGKAGGFIGFLPELSALGRYAMTVLSGLAIHALLVLPLILWFFTKRNPMQYARGMGAALLNAFSTASSSATLPLTMEAVEEENGVSNRTASFVLPLGATVNMDGTALYEAVAALFIAQVYGIHIGFSGQMIIFLTATLAAIGAAGIPEAGLVTMVIVLRSVGLPIEGIGLLLSIDWLLDRFRTTVNVWGDSVGAAVIDHLENHSRK